MANIFLDALRGLYELRLTLDSNPVVAGLTVANYTKQLLGNRLSSHTVACQCKINNKPVVVKIHKWQPARQGDSPGYAGEKVLTSESGSGDIWSLYANGNISEDNAIKECVALMAYFIDQVYSGKGDSGETIGKLLCLEYLWLKLKPKDFTLTRQLTDKSELMEYENTHINGLIRAYAPRMSAVKSLEPKKKINRKGGQRQVVNLS